MRRRRKDVLWAALLAVSASILVAGLAVRWLPVEGSSPAPDPTGQPAVLAPGGSEPSFDDYFTVGVHALKVGMGDEARRMFEEARNLQPQVPEVHVNLGFAYLAVSDAMAAEASFRKAIDLRPGQVNAYYGWAESLELLGDLPGAMGAMRTYLHLSPEDDAFRVKAMAALWEWEARVSPPDQPAPEPPESEAKP